MGANFKKSLIITFRTNRTDNPVGLYGWMVRKYPLGYIFGTTTYTLTGPSDC